jgi:DNA-binding winged helix-turn-helix (wHTH) protein/tetratricopeptide (TPR) repeat protein
VSGLESFAFGPFRLDSKDERLWRGDAPIPLTPKAFSVLLCLLRSRGRLVTKRDLLDGVWPDVIVGDAVLKVAIREIRVALGDDARGSRYVETVHRRGYRFTGPAAVPATAPATASDAPASSTPRPSLAASLVGRAEVLATLDRLLADARRGERRTVFLSGPPGIGKTAVVEAFLSTTSGLVTLRGECVEQYGSGEAYLPLFDAISRLARERGVDAIRTLLYRHAPTWLAEISSLVEAGDRERLRRETLGATRERMLREMVGVIEALAADAPVVLVLEDLHWGDYSTLDVVSLLARRREPAHVLVLVTYRPEDAIVAQHPLRAVERDLEAHGLLHGVPLGLLPEEATAEVLRGRLGGAQPPASLVRALHGRTEGNPLFLLNVIDYLVSRGILAVGEGRIVSSVTPPEIEKIVPEGLRRMIDVQVDRLAEGDQRLLEAASVAGAEFSAAAVAYAMEETTRVVEERCEALVRRGQFLRPRGVSSLPDGTLSGRFAFAHSLFPNVLAERILPTQRARLHLRMGEGGERAFGPRAAEIATELAAHFEEAREFDRAVRFLRIAAETDARRCANREALAHLERALDLMRGHGRGDDPEFDLLESIGRVHRAMGDMKGAAAAFEKMVAAARAVGRADREATALLYLVSALFWVRRDRCIRTVDEALALAPRLEDPALRAHVRGYCGHWNLNLRPFSEDDVRACREAIEALRESGDRQRLSLHLTRYTYALCVKGDYAGAAANAAEAVPLAESVGDAFDWLLGQFFRGWALLHAGRFGETRSVLESGLDLAARNGHALWESLFRIGLAHLHVEALDPERAIDEGEPALKDAERDRVATGQLYFHGQIVLGLAEVAARRPAVALERLRPVVERLHDPAALLDRILHLPLRLGLASARLARADVAGARGDASLLVNEARSSGERTYGAHGHRLLAECALADGDLDAAERECQAALDLAADDAPLARWRVLAVAAAVSERRGSAAEGARRRAAVGEALDALAGSFAPEDPLRARMLERRRDWERPAVKRRRRTRTGGP